MNKAVPYLTILFLILTSHFGKGATMIRAQLFKLPEKVEISAVTTAGHYILATHLVRTLTKLDKLGQIQADVITKWHSKDNKIWTLTVGKEKFSNGDLITVEDIVRSIQRQQRLEAGVHFGFSEIQSVEAIDHSNLEITLKNERNDFIYDLSKPEFGILHKSDQLLEKNKLKLEITSGPYYLQEKDGAKFKLKRNPYYKSDVQNDLDLEIEDSNGEKSIRDLLSRKVDFVTTQQNIPLAQHHSLESSVGIRMTKPHVAFSYWLSINPNSHYFKDKKNRSHLQNIVDRFKTTEIDGTFWEKANQIYLPDGDGRPTEQEIDEIWNIIRAKKMTKKVDKVKLRIIPLKMTNRLLDDLLKYLGTIFEIQMLPYSTEEELKVLIKSGNFDIKISANDFSSVDLSENLKTTFNANRPYIFLNESSLIPIYMSKITQTSDKSERSSLYKKIGINLLEEGLIAPIAYQRAWFYSLDRVNISAWSKLYPEISFWKMSVHD